MFIGFTVIDLITLALFGATVWMMYARYAFRIDSNWPLVYYALLVTFLNTYGGMDPFMVYAGVVAALFLRFEFMGGAFLKFVRLIEFVVLLYVAWRCLRMTVLL
ncbi:MAG: hypothetical protein ACK5AZ_07730 [Bryobacteraceae bacterium]